MRRREVTAMEGIFWAPPSETSLGALPDGTDILVIGGGIAGTSLMHPLARRRFSAVLVESRHLAFGASGRNAGFLLAGVADCYAEAGGIFGRSKGREGGHITHENHDRMLEAADRDDVGHRRLGSATLASGDEERARLEESAQLLRDDGFEASWDGEHLVNPRDGEINPAAMVGALARRAKPGAIREGVEVTSVVPGSVEVSVRAGDSECRAGVVILATNAYTSKLLPQVKIQPTRAQMVASAPIYRTLSDMPTYSHFGYRYWRQLPTGEVLIGGWRDTSMETEIGWDDEPSAEIQEHLDRKLGSMSKGAEITRRWAGLTGVTQTRQPLAGPVDWMRNLYLCAGFNGPGMGFAFITPKQAVDAI